MPEMTLHEALDLADQDSPMPHLAGQALKVLHEELEQAHGAVMALLAEKAIAGNGQASCGGYIVGVDMGSGDRGCQCLMKASHGASTLLREFFTARSPSTLEAISPSAKDC